MARRTIGTIHCKGCNQDVDVVYPYSNSDISVGIVDHDVPESMRHPWLKPEEFQRCPHAGLSLTYAGRKVTNLYTEDDLKGARH